MTTTNVYGRQVVVPLTNKSGGGVIAGDVVVVDTANNDAFTTSTSGAFTGGVGVAQETIASNAVGRVLIAGYAALVLTSASVTRGNFGKTHTVAKQAVDAGAARTVGTFCQFLTGGTTPDAIVYPADLGGGASVTAVNQLAADVTMTNADTYYDGPSLSINGTYLLLATVSTDGANASVSQTAKLWNGSTVAASTEQLAYGGAAGRKYSSLSLSAIVTTSGSETWKVSVAGDGAGGKILAAAANNGAGNNASTLTALKLT